jgi:hypothetical protein
VRLITAAAILALGLVVSALIGAHPATDPVTAGPGHAVPDPVVIADPVDPDTRYFQPIP